MNLASQDSYRRGDRVIILSNRTFQNHNRGIVTKTGKTNDGDKYAFVTLDSGQHTTRYFKDLDIVKKCTYITK